MKGFGLFAVEEKSGGEVIGCIGLWQPEGWPEIELGYWLRAAYRGRGFAREAGLRCIAHARDSLGARSLVSYIDPGNGPSIKVAESLGARFETTIELLDRGPHRVYRHF